MKKITKSEVVFSSKEVKDITGFELKNRWGDFYLKQDRNLPFWERESSKDFEMYINEIEELLKDYANKNFLGEFATIVQNGSIHYRTAGYTEQFHSNNNSEIFFYYEDKDDMDI